MLFSSSTPGLQPRLETLISYCSESLAFPPAAPPPVSSSAVFYREVSAVSTHTCFPPIRPAVNSSKLPIGPGNSAAASGCFPGSHFPPSPAFLSQCPPSPSPLEVLLSLPCSQCGYSFVLASRPSFLDLVTGQLDPDEDTASESPSSLSLAVMSLQAFQKSFKLAWPLSWCSLSLCGIVSVSQHPDIPHPHQAFPFALRQIWNHTACISKGL